MGDPDGNGKDDTYGLCLCKYTGPLDIIQAWFGAGNQWKGSGRKADSHPSDRGIYGGPEMDEKDV